MEVLNNLIVHMQPNHFWVAMIVTISFILGLIGLAYRLLKSYHLVVDTPTSKTRSAAQGYVELEGRTALLEGTPIFSPLSGEPCVWYSYQVEKNNRRNNKTFWETVEQETSEAIFLLRDETGQCVIDPDGANVTTTHSRSWRGNMRNPAALNPDLNQFLSNTDFSCRRGDYRYSEKIIRPTTPLYAIGQFTSMDSVRDEHTVNADVRDLLASWKQNPKLMLKRFDADQDGKIDMEEWDQARFTAKKETVQSKVQESRSPQLHIMRKPTQKNQPYILSTNPQKKIIDSYQWFLKSTICIVMFVTTLLVYAFSIRITLI